LPFVGLVQTWSFEQCSSRLTGAFSLEDNFRAKEKIMVQLLPFWILGAPLAYAVIDLLVAPKSTHLAAGRAG
jgi:hypothetical protein